MFRLKMYPAKNGDAFLVDADGTHILIDAGFASTYHNFIATDLAQLAVDGGRLDLVVCTHIDADHIGGLLEFFSLNGTPDRRGIEVSAIWHNSLRSLPASAAVPDGVADQMVLESIRRLGFPGVAGSSSTPISARQGSSLAKLLRQYGYTWNSGDGTTYISAGDAPVSLSSSVSVHVIGPTTARLEELRELWLREVQKLGYRGSSDPSDLIDDAYEMWCANAPAPLVPQATPIAARASLRLADVYISDTSVIERTPDGPDAEKVFALVLRWRDYVAANVENRFELVPELLQIVPLLTGLKATEEALRTYQLVLSFSMGPSWYKEDQLSMMTGTLETLPPTSPVQAALLTEIAGLLERATGEMTFQRFVRADKGNFIGELCRRKLFSDAIRYFQHQSCGTLDELFAQATTGNLDRVSTLVGMRFPGAALEEQAALLALLRHAREQTSWHLRWALLEVYQHGDERQPSWGAPWKRLSRRAVETTQIFQPAVGLQPFDTP